MTILVIAMQRFANPEDGYHLRAWHLCRQLAGVDSLVLVPTACSENDGDKGVLDSRDLFDEMVEPLVLPDARPSFIRHLRFSTAGFYSLGYPRFYRRAIEVISATLKRHAASRIVVFGWDLAGFLMPFRSAKVLFDVCDSGALFIERDAPFRTSMTLVEKLRWRMMCWRQLNTERRLPHWFTHVTAASDMDNEAIRRVSRCNNVTTIPNGVSPALEQPLARPNRPWKRGVVFWGNLATSPNARAIRFFFDGVYEPYLAAAGVEWCIVGRRAEPWVEAAARRYPLIRATGFVENLNAVVSDYPVFVNPMISGNGIKNKVLEALALGKAVVSTPLGIESIAGAVNGQHYVEASTPEAMAESVLALLKDPARCEMLGSNARRLIMDQYTWERAGNKFRSVLEAL